jgi:hypothetical protein
MNNYNKNELENLLIFMQRVELKGSESYAWVGLVEKIKNDLNELMSPKEATPEKLDIK